MNIIYYEHTFVFKNRIKFGKEFNASGKYSNDGHLWLLDRNEINPLLLSITIGNNENKFAIITDEMNNIVYNYGRNILSNFEQKSLEEIVKEVSYIVFF